MKYTIVQFKKDFPTEASCLDKIFQLRYGKLQACTGCGVIDPEYRRITTRRSYQCRHCYHQLYPTAGTVFEKTRTSLTSWFYALYLMTSTRNGVSAKELERQLGVTYKTAWRMGHQIRKLMQAGLGSRMFSGFVEVDETFIGGKEKNKHKDKRTKGSQGVSTKTKSVVVGMVERRGEVRAMKVDHRNSTTTNPLITTSISKDAIVSTDEATIYNGLSSLGYQHGIVKHGLGQYRNGPFCTNTIEGFFSYLKRTLSGTHIQVSPKYLQQYVDECCYRYNRRGLGGAMFTDLLYQLSQDGQQALTTP